MLVLHGRHAAQVARQLDGRRLQRQADMMPQVLVGAQPARQCFTAKGPAEKALPGQQALVQGPLPPPLARMPSAGR